MIWPPSKSVWPVMWSDATGARCAPRCRADVSIRPTKLSADAAPVSRYNGVFPSDGAGNRSMLATQEHGSHTVSLSLKTHLSRWRLCLRSETSGTPGLYLSAGFIGNVALRMQRESRLRGHGDGPSHS
jgi:hypothetical protein